MLQNAYVLDKIGADTAENELNSAEILPIGRRVADHQGLDRRRALLGRGRAPRHRRRGPAPPAGPASATCQNIWRLHGAVFFPGNFTRAKARQPLSGKPNDWEEAREEAAGLRAAGHRLCFLAVPPAFFSSRTLTNHSSAPKS